MLAPLTGLGQIGDGQGQLGTVDEAEGKQALQALVHVIRAIGPVPDKQTNLRGRVGVQLVALQRPGHLAARGAGAGLGLHMAGLAPVQLTLQDQFIVRR